jgi:hypothetical protein
MADRAEIPWQRDFDAAQKQAAEQRRHVLLDFTAAPM